jgi:predicted protein tyrosine phosphatase
MTLPRWLVPLEDRSSTPIGTLAIALATSGTTPCYSVLYTAGTPLYLGSIEWAEILFYMPLAHLIGLVDH